MGRVIFMKKVAILSVIILLCSVSVAFGYVVGNSNLPIGQYPGFDEYGTMRPRKPFSHNQFDDDQYRRNVQMYVQEAQQYVEAANYDIQRIVEAKQNAIADANEVINEYNNYVNSF